MSSPLPVRIVGSAGQAILDAAEWWLANRPKAPDAFAVELERAFQLLASQPLIGAQLETSHSPVSAGFTFPASITISIIV